MAIMLATPDYTVMPRRIKLPPHGPDRTHMDLHSSRAVASCRARWRTLHLSVVELHPVLRVAHRLIGNVGVRYREIGDFEFIAVLDGHGVFQLGEQLFRYGPGSLLFIPPCVPHTLITRSGREGDHLAVHFDLSPQCPGSKRPGNYRVELNGLRLPPAVSNWDDTSLALLAEAVTQRQASDPGSALRASVALQRLLLHLHDREEADDNDQLSDPAITAALACIADHYHEQLSVADLAAAAGLQRSRFAQRFKQWCGRPPMAFVRRYRIDRAADILRWEPGQPLAEIAMACGFADAFSFSKAFRAEMGQSPSEFRQD